MSKARIFRAVFNFYEIKYLWSENVTRRWSFELYCPSVLLFSCYQYLPLEKVIWLFFDYVNESVLFRKYWGTFMECMWLFREENVCFNFHAILSAVITNYKHLTLIGKKYLTTDYLQYSDLTSVLLMIHISWTLVHSRARILIEEQSLQMRGTETNTFISVYSRVLGHVIMVIYIPLEVGKDLYLHLSKHSTYW